MSYSTMHSKVTTAPGPALSRPELRGRASGILVLAFFGLGWASWGSSVGVPSTIGTWITVLTIVLGIACAFAAALIFRRARTAPSGHNDAQGRAVGRRFGMVVGIEFLGLGLVSWLMAGIGRENLIPALICLGVGVHFFPLARLFGLPVYFGTGLALCLISVATVALALLISNDTLWTVLPGLGAAVTLFLSCGILATSTLRHTASAVRTRGRSHGR